MPVDRRMDDVEEFVLRLDRAILVGSLVPGVARVVDDVLKDDPREKLDQDGDQHIVVKVGGLGMAMGWFDFYQRPTPPGSQELAEAFRPWVETCIELFGVNRCMYESNFPVDKITSGYGVLWNAFKRISAKVSADEKAALFSGTASRVYRL